MFKSTTVEIHLTHLPSLLLDYHRDRSVIKDAIATSTGSDLYLKELSVSYRRYLMQRLSKRPATSSIPQQLTIKVIDHAPGKKNIFKDLMEQTMLLTRYNL